MKEKENWKDVKGFEGAYQVSDLGNVKSLKRKDRLGRNVKERILKTQLNKTTGYSIISLTLNTKLITKHIHQLVAIAFLGHVPNGHKLVVNHIDENKNNNRLDNLEVVTTRENILKYKANNSTKILGAYKLSNGKYTSLIVIEGKTIYLGTFDTELKAHDYYIKCLNKWNEKKTVPKRKKRPKKKFRKVVSKSGIHKNIEITPVEAKKLRGLAVKDIGYINYLKKIDKYQAFIIVNNKKKYLKLCKGLNASIKTYQKALAELNK
tara:strand:- start:367 stop:1158 length:792 start_codon:yes stop_codon:yes gene_type:complete